MNCCNKDYCPICMENKLYGIKCQICTNTKICNSCIAKLCEQGQVNKCPVCRQENWKEPKCITKIFPSTKCKNIIPRSRLRYLQEKSQISCFNFNDIYNCLFISFYIIKLLLEICIGLIVIYITGLFSLAIVNSNYFKDSNTSFVYNVFIPFMIGICIWVSCCGCCNYCYKNKVMDIHPYN